MSKLTPCSIVNDFKDNGKKPQEYIDTISELLISFCLTEEFYNMTTKEKCSLVERCQEVKALLSDIGKLNPEKWKEPCESAMD